MRDFEEGDMLDLRRLGTDLRVRYKQVDRVGTANDKTLVQMDVNGDGEMKAGGDRCRWPPAFVGVGCSGCWDWGRLMTRGTVTLHWRPGYGVGGDMLR